MWRAGYWRCVRCRYDNYSPNVDCRRCGAGGKEEGRDCGERRRDHRERGGGEERRGRKMKGCSSIRDRKEERSGGGKRCLDGTTSGELGKTIIPLSSHPVRNVQKPSKVTRSPPLDVTDQDLDRSEELLEQDFRDFVKTKPTLDNLEQKAIEKKKIKEGFAKVRKRLNTSQDRKSKNMTIVSPDRKIKTLDNFSDGKTSLFVETSPDIAEYFGKFGTIFDINEDDEGISKITFYKKSSAIKVLSSSHKHKINFYDDTRQDWSADCLEEYDIPCIKFENWQGGGEDSRGKAFKNYEGDVDSFLFGTEDVGGRLTSAQTGHGKWSKRTRSRGLNPEMEKSDSDRRVSVSVYSSRRSDKRLVNHLQPSTGKDTDRRFVREAEEDKWRIAVKNCKKINDFADDKDKEKMQLAVEGQHEHDPCSSKQDAEGKAKKVDQANVKAKLVIVKPVRVPNALERKLMALAGSYEEAGSSSEKVVLRSKNSEVTDVEVVDLADSDEDCVEVVEKLLNVDNNQNLLSKLKKANESEEEAILKSMGIVSKPLEDPGVDTRGSQLVE